MRIAAGINLEVIPLQLRIRDFPAPNPSTEARGRLLVDGILTIGAMLTPGPADDIALATSEAVRVYSVAFETTIPRMGIGTRQAHFAAANRALLAEMKGNAELASHMDQLGIRVPTNAAGSVKGTSPTGWTWHHVPDQPGVLQLVPRAQHTSGTPFYEIMHPSGHGGFYLWGAQF